MLLYYITDRTQFPGDEAARRRALLEKITEAVSCGVDFIQLREKDLNTRDLEALANSAARIIQKSTAKQTTRLLVNSRIDVAIATGADGVHLRSDDISITQCGGGRLTRPTIISISCHSPEEVAQAASEGADLALFAPVFEKKDVPGAKPTGLEALRQASSHKIPVLALGGVTLENAHSCLDAGAAGISAIRLFQKNDIRRVVETVRKFA